MQFILKQLFSMKLSQKRIEKYLNQKLQGQRNMESDLDSKSIRVSCVQRNIKLVGSIGEYIDLQREFVRRAVADNSSLVVFPEYNFVDLLGLIPGFKPLSNNLNRNSKSNEGSPKGGSPEPLMTAFKAMANFLQTAIETIFARLSSSYKVNIYTGSYMVMDNGALFNVGSLFSKHGELLGSQRKLHLTAFEDNLGLGRDCRLQTFDLNFARVACPICMDATYFETFKIAADLGSDIVIIPIANNEEYHPYKALRGIWPRVQESYVYGLKAALNGWLGGVQFTGRAGIFAPVELSANRDGVVALTEDHVGDYLVTGTINLEKLRQARKNAEYFGDVNREFEADYTVIYNSSQYK